MPNFDESNYISIIPTAYLTAYPRIFTDIPYSKQIFDKFEEFRKEDKLQPVSKELKIKRLAPELEARYKLIDKLLEEADVQQVLELAAGLSPRGLIATLNEPNITYVEVELKEMANLKQRVVRSIADTPPNFHIVDGSALNIDILNEIVQKFFALSTRIAFINEGLLRYLSFKEKTQVAKNIHSILSRFGGVWITCDTTPKSFLVTQDNTTKPGMNKNLSKMTGRNFNNNMFDHEAHVKSFFTDLGFSIELHPFVEIEDQLTSPSKLKLSDEETEKLFGSGVVAVMKAK